jgi:hypothetical protein
MKLYEFIQKLKIETKLQNIEKIKDSTNIADLSILKSNCSLALKTIELIIDNLKIIQKYFTIEFRTNINSDCVEISILNGTQLYIWLPPFITFTPPDQNTDSEQEYPAINSLTYTLKSLDSYLETINKYIDIANTEIEIAGLPTTSPDELAEQL